jgi:hypothetical protein
MPAARRCIAAEDQELSGFAERGTLQPAKIQTRLDRQSTLARSVPQNAVVSRAESPIKQHPDQFTTNAVHTYLDRARPRQVDLHRTCQRARIGRAGWKDAGETTVRIPVCLCETVTHCSDRHRALPQLSDSGGSHPRHCFASQPACRAPGARIPEADRRQGDAAEYRRALLGAG